MKDITILIIDDDESTRKFLGAALDDLQCKLLMAEEGVAAYQLLQAEHVDIVITDIYMPNINGLELIQHLSQTKPQIKTIAMSGDYRQHNHNALEWARAAGAVGILEKPFEPEVLIRMVKDVIASMA